MELFNSKELEHLRWAINVILFGRCSAYRTRGRSICYNPLNYKARIKQDGTPKEPSGTVEATIVTTANASGNWRAWGV